MEFSQHLIELGTLGTFIRGKHQSNMNVVGIGIGTYMYVACLGK